MEVVMPKNEAETLSFRLTEEQLSVLKRRESQDRPAMEVAAETVEADNLEPSFRAWNAAFVDPREPLPE
jgi:hypothetical protein